MLLCPVLAGSYGSSRLLTTGNSIKFFHRANLYGSFLFNKNSFHIYLTNGQLRQFKGGLRQYL